MEIPQSPLPSSEVPVIHACMARAFSSLTKDETRQLSPSPRLPAHKRYTEPLAMLSCTAATTCASERRRGSSRRSNALCGRHFSCSAKGLPLRRTMASRLLVNAFAVERLVKRVATKRREPHLLHRTSASSSVRLSPIRAFSVSAVRRPRRMQCWHLKPISRAPTPLAIS